jgi:hypothetical protein
MFWVLLSLFNNKVASRTLIFFYKTIEFFFNLVDVDYNRSQVPKILLEVHIDQFGITFVKHTKIYLNDRK